MCAKGAGTRWCTHYGFVAFNEILAIFKGKNRQNISYTYAVHLIMLYFVIVLYIYPIVAVETIMT